MERAKNIVMIVVLVAVAVGAAVYGILRIHRGPPPRPDWMMSEPMTLIDAKTYATTTKPRQEWEKLGRKGQNRYKNPETGEYTMSPVMQCGACGQQIPVPENLKSLLDMEAYICPKCGRHVRQ